MIAQMGHTPGTGAAKITCAYSCIRSSAPPFARLLPDGRGILLQRIYQYPQWSQVRESNPYPRFILGLEDRCSAVELTRQIGGHRRPHADARRRMGMSCHAARRNAQYAKYTYRWRGGADLNHQRREISLRSTQPPQRRPMPGRLTENTASWLAVATAITACSLRGFVQGVSITQSLSAVCSAAPSENWNDGMELNHPGERQQIRPLPSRRISPVFSRLPSPFESFVGGCGKAQMWFPLARRAGVKPAPFSVWHIHRP